MTISRHQTLKSLLLATTLFAMPLIAVAPTAAQAEVALGISVQLAPPILPVYDQPPMPDVGYIWTPGYWAWADPTGYYWVPGTWVQPPTVGVLWTPPYWGWVGGLYVFNAGYWGPHVGFYGGVNYGFGYGGRGYDGGHWDHGRFAYNRTVNNFGSVHVNNTYVRNVTVINHTRVSYNGGTGGVHVRATAAESQAAHESHVPVTAEQTRHIEAAHSNPDFAARHNNGRPAVAATSHPGQFEGAGVTHPRSAITPVASTRPAHPNSTQAAQPRPQHPQATQAAQPRPPQHPQATQAATPRPLHPETRQAAQPQRAARPAQARAPDEKEKDKDKN